MSSWRDPDGVLAPAPRAALSVALACALASASLASVFRGWAFFPPVLGGIALTVAGGELARWARVPGWVGPLLSAALVVCYLAALDPGPAPLGFLPYGRGLDSLAATTRAGFHDIRHLATPVPATPGLVLLAVAGVALMTLVVYLCTVVLETPAACGVLLFAVFLVAASVAPHGVGVGGFLTTLAGFLVLLAADGRARALRWGRWVRPGVAGSRRPAPRLGLRIGAATAVGALVVPALFPFVHERRLAHPYGPGDGPGKVATTFNPILSIGADLNRPQTETLFTVHTTDVSPEYLQLTTLDTFNNDSWVASRDLTAPPSAAVARGLPKLQLSGVTTSKGSERITMAGTLDVNWLPLPYPATSVRVSGDWRYDSAFATVFSASTSTLSLHSYRVGYLHVSPSAAQLRALAGGGGGPEPGAPAVDLQLPARFPAVIGTIARHVTAGHRGELAEAIALQDYLDAPPFSYSTTVADRDGSSEIVNFLTRTRSGYCVQFATAMALLARALGIPARVAVGFTPGTQVDPNDWVVTTADAHAWPELYFPGAGWLRFEPTPRSDGQATVPVYATPQAGGTSGRNQVGAGSAGSTPKATAPAGPNLQAGHSHPYSGAAGSGSGARRTAGAFPWVSLLLLGLLVLAVATPAALRVGARRRRWRAPPGRARVEAMWAELADTAVDLGWRWPVGASPRRAAATLAEGAEFPGELRPRLTALRGAVETARYAPPGSVISEDPAAALHGLVHGMRRARGTRTRMRARLLPASTLHRLGTRS